MAGNKKQNSNVRNIKRRQNVEENNIVPAPARRLSFERSISMSPETTRIPDSHDNINLGKLLHKKWKTFRASPLYNFDVSKMKVYGKKLSESLAATTNLSRRPVTYQTTFVECPELKMSSNCRSGLQIKIVQNGIQAPCYVGYFLIWDNHESQSLLTSGLTSFPILLVKSTKTVSTRVHNILCKFFDCEIYDLTLNNDFIKLFCYIINIPREISAITSDVILYYEIPAIPPKDKIIVSLNLEEIATVILSIKRELQQTRMQKLDLLMKSFYGKILNHIFETCKLNLSKARLYRIKLCDVDIYIDGQVYCSNPECMNITLALLNEFAVVLESECPAMAKDIS